MKVTKHGKKQENAAYNEEKSQSIETDAEQTHLLELANKDLKTGILTVFHESQMLGRNTEDIKKKKKAQTDLLGMKTPMCEMKNTPNAINRRLDVAEEKIGEVEDSAIEIIQRVTHRGKRIFKN